MSRAKRWYLSQRHEKRRRHAAVESSPLRAESVSTAKFYINQRDPTYSHVAVTARSKFRGSETAGFFENMPGVVELIAFDPLGRIVGMSDKCLGNIVSDE
jgi:hypothetical protein